MNKKINEKWKCPDHIWDELQKILHNYVASPLGGRPPVDRRRVADGIFYVLRAYPKTSLKVIIEQAI